MIKVGSSVSISPHSSIAFQNKEGVVIKIVDGVLLPYMVSFSGVNMTMMFSEDDLIELPD